MAELSQSALSLDVGNTFIDTRTVDTHMRRLRDKLGPYGRWIETVRGFGYRFAAPR